EPGLRPERRAGVAQHRRRAGRGCGAGRRARGTAARGLERRLHRRDPRPAGPALPRAPVRARRDAPRAQARGRSAARRARPRPRDPRLSRRRPGVLVRARRAREERRRQARDADRLVRLGAHAVQLGLRARMAARGALPRRAALRVRRDARALPRARAPRQPRAREPVRGGGAVSGALVLSPHLDDAVLGCGAWIAAHAGVRVLTVFAGAPSAAAGIAARRAEDRAALELLGAEPEWLDWCDDQYGVPAPEEALAADLRRALERHDPRTVLVPLGLFHRDHERTHEAALALVGEQRSRAWYAYEDALYRAIPGLVQRRLLRLGERRVTATPEPTRGASGRKRRALACYASQLRGLATPGRPGHADALAAERLWRLTL